MTRGTTEAQPGGDDLSALEHAITTLESQRAVLGDAVVDTALMPLQARRRALVDRSRGEQRRLVTVVFADLVGFTDLSGWLDAEDTRNIVNAYFGRWLRAIEAHGGVVEKFIGDAVMAVFGLRQSWEDDAARAVRSSLAMVAELADLNAELQRRYGVRLRMRVGVDTGDVVVSTLGDRGDSEFVVVGQTVNRASRIQSAAPPDGIVISESTHRQIRGRFSMERREGMVLKGIDGPVTTFLVVNERPHSFQLDRGGGIEGVETTTVGREIELRFLQERLWDVVEEGRWRLVSVIGDAGVGKSRLLLDFDSWLAERPESVWWFRGRASHTGQNRANALLRDLVGSRFGISVSDAPAQVSRKLEQGFAGVFDAPGEARQVADLVGTWLNFDLGGAEGGTEETDGPAGSASSLDPQMLRDRATETLAEYLSRLSVRAPVVVLLEDLHWADDGSLRWLDAADALLDRSRVLVVATARPSLFEERPRWGEGLAHHVRLPLPALSRRESRMLLLQILQHVPDPPTELLDLVIDSADGNPFYIEELVTWLVDAGVVVKAEDAWRVELDLVGSVVVPSTLRGVLQARLDSLSGQERTLLQRASVVGRVFWDAAVEQLAPDDTRGPATSAATTLGELRSRELVFEREVSSFDSAREFLFKHALLRDVAYDGVLRVHRQRYHARAAAWLAEASAQSGRQEEYAALIAEHYDRAEDPAAGPWYFRAGAQAASVYALDEAARLLQRALDLVEDPDQRLDVLLTREAMLDRLGERDAQDLDLVEMEQLLEQVEDPVRTCHVQLARSRWCFVVSRYDEAETWAERAIAVAEDAGLQAEVAEAHLWQGKSLVWHDEVDAARSTLDQALRQARAAHRTLLEAESLRYLSMLANNEGDYPRALELGEQARVAFDSIGDLEGEGTALGQQASTLYNMGRLPEARSALEQVLPIFRRSGHLYRVALCLGNLGAIAIATGELGPAQGWMEEAAERMHELHDREARGNNLVGLGIIASATASWSDAEAFFREALEIQRDVESRPGETEALTRLAFSCLDRGDHDAALRWAHEAAEAAELVMSPMERGHAQLALGYAELATGSASTADEAFRQSRDCFHTLAAAAMMRETEVGRAAVALSRGDLDEAVALVDPMRDRLSWAGIEGMARAVTVMHTCWRVLVSARDPQEGEVLRQVRATLRVAADRMGDGELAAGFRRVPLVAELLDDTDAGTATDVDRATDRATDRA